MTPGTVNVVIAETMQHLLTMSFPVSVLAQATETI